MGKKRPSLKTILSVANALGTTADDLLIDIQGKSIPSVKKEENALLTDCTEKQKRFIIAICNNIKNEMIKYDTNHP